MYTNTFDAIWYAQSVLLWENNGMLKMTTKTMILPLCKQKKFRINITTLCILASYSFSSFVIKWSITGIGVLSGISKSETEVLR